MMMLSNIFRSDWQRSFRVKFTAPLILLTIAISGFMYFFFSAWLENRAFTAIKLQAKSVGDSAALNVGRALILGEEKEVELIVKQAKKISDLVFMAVFDESEREVASFNFSRNPRIIVSKCKDDEILANGLIYSTITPVVINNREIGHIHTGLSLKAFNKDVLHIRTIIAILSCLILAIGTAVILLASKIACKPIEDMASMAARVAGGDHSQRASTAMGIALNGLTDSFNAIVSDLAHARNDVEKLNQKIQEQEEQRKREEIARKKIEMSFLASLEAADTALMAKSKIVGRICKELYRPITSIIDSTELLYDSSLNQNQLEPIREIKTSSSFMMSLIRNMLDIANIDSGKFALTKTEFSLREGMTRCIHPFMLKAKQKQVMLLMEISPSVPDTLVGDEGRLHQIVRSLLDNALKFTEKGEVRLKIVLEEGRVPGVKSGVDRICLHFSVSDTGIGIPPDKHEIIFDLFSQTPSHLLKPEEGIGLGLPISRRLIELMDGFVWVDSKEDKGSTFHFLAQFEKVKKGIDDREFSEPMKVGMNDNELMHEGR